MGGLKKFVDGIDAMSEWCGRLFSWFLVTLVGLSIYEVITRRLFGHPTIWTFETLGYLFCATVMLTMGYVLRHKGHVHIDIYTARLSPRSQAILEVITFILFLGFFTTVFLWKGIIYAGMSWMRLERAPSAFNFYVFPAKTLIPVGAALLLIQGIADAIRNIVFVIKGERL